MLLDFYQLVIIQFISYASLFITLFFLIKHVLLRISLRANRWKNLNLRHLESTIIHAQNLLKIFGLSQTNPHMQSRMELLKNCGLQIHTLFYEFLRRLCCIMTGFLIILSYLALHYPILLLNMNPYFIGLASIILLIFLCNDKKILEQLKKNRNEKIVKEIYLVSHQLLYYTNSHLNLHAKLAKCVGLTKTIRQAFEILLNEWYQDAEQAINAFKSRVSSDEAHSFAETLHAIRLNESESYYNLMRQRIQDFKEKIELSKDSRKETISYVLFILAGLPIMNTFRVFMYPWIAEGQKIFNGLN